MNRILIIDDHPIMRMGLIALLRTDPDLEVVAEAGTAAEGLELAKEEVELILLDLALPDRGGLELLKDILAQRPGTRVLVISSHDEEVYAERVLRAGARGYIMKEEAPDRLITAVGSVLAGEIYVSDKITHQIIQIFSGQKPKSSDPTSALTDRELEVFTLIGEGKGSKEIGEALGISSRTADAHRAHIKEKLDLADSRELLREAVRWLEAERP